MAIRSGFFFLWFVLPFSFSPAEADQSASVPVPVQEPYWVRAFAAQQRLLNRKVDWCFAGDSLTEHWKSTGKPIMDLEFRDTAIANLGISADRTEHLLFRIQKLNFVRAKPAKIVVLIGTNNLAKNDPDSPVETAAAIEKVVRTLVQKCPESGIHLLKILPSGYQPDSQLRRRISETNERLDVLNKMERVRVHDFSDLFVNAEGIWLPGMTIDGTHLSLTGYDHFGRALKEVLNESAP
ncbi:GDSL-type esterase/lipase family protein [Verrucomicrobiales bacterium BCK34]|nr:GDSL-type esterase/lipase family protein [Verrucomicrobiales bacterium BCK34]